jgi:hypothetical protein
MAELVKSDRRKRSEMGWPDGRRMEPSLTMSRSELDRLSDHELLLLLHERLQAHLDEHKWWTSAYRWAVLALIACAAAAAAWRHP